MITRYKTKHVFQPIARNVWDNGSEILISLMNTFHKEKRLKHNNSKLLLLYVYNQRLS